MLKVFFFTESPINKIYSRKINLEYISQNFQTEIWTTFSQNEEYFKKSKNYLFDFSKLIIIKNKFILFKKLFKIKNQKNLFIYLDYNSSINIFFLLLLKIFKIEFIVPPRRTPFVFDRKRENLFYRIYKRDKTNLNNEIKNKIKFLLFNFFNNLNFIQRPMIIFVCGNKGFDYWKKYFKPKKLIKTKSVDLLYNQFDRLLNYQYCVYIDENKNFSPDLSFLKGSDTKTVFDLNSFYNNLNLFFKKIENKFNCKVVIASSLKFDYKNTNPFFNRLIFYDKTNELIQNSELVICHHSSGYWQAIYDFKKILFLTDINLEYYNQNSTIRDNANLFNLNSIDTNDDVTFLDKTINIEVYKNILNDYFVVKNDINYNDIIINEINNLMN